MNRVKTKLSYIPIAMMMVIMMITACNLNDLAELGEDNSSEETSTAEDSGDEFTISHTLSEGAQRNTIAFAGLAYITGDMCSDSFLPPGKVADFFGFQHLRDNDDDEMGHNTSFVTKIANNVLYILSDSQVVQLVTLAQDQVELINEYAYKRFTLMDAFHRLRIGDVPEDESLNKNAVMEYSAELFRIDGLISVQRAEVLGDIIRSLNESQLTYLDDLAAEGMLSWPDMEDQVDPQSLDHDTHVAVMTYASQLFSWYAGSVDADTYFCPERQAMYFGSFYLKDIPAMGNPDYTIDESLTADSGEIFLEMLNDSQAELITGLVNIQYDGLLEIVDTRSEIAEELRFFMTDESVDDETILSLAEQYGELDGELAYYYVTRFLEIASSLSLDQEEDIMALRNLDNYPCAGAYLYSENIEMPEIIDTDFMFSE